MIICPQCGEESAEGTKFCERCGQGLAATVARPPTPKIAPLAAGTELLHGYRIVKLISQSSQENRYKAERAGAHGREIFQLREQLGAVSEALTEEVSSHEGAGSEIQVEQDPAGPRAKTADLKLRPRASAANGSGAAAPATIMPGAATPTAITPAPATNAAAAVGGAQEEYSGHDSTVEVIDAANAIATRAVEPAPAVVAAPDLATAPDTIADTVEASPQAQRPQHIESHTEDLGETFGRVRALSLTLNHPAIYRATDGFAESGRVYLAYPDEQLTPLANRAGGLRLTENEALSVAIQLCQAVAFIHRRGLRVNDLCPEAIALSAGGRVKLLGLDYVSNDNELQSAPIFNDGYTAPEIYRGKKADKRADVFAIGAVLYTCLTGERLEAESWREEAGEVRFYPPHVVTPALESVVRRALSFDPQTRWASVEALKAELVKLAGVVEVRAAALTDVGKVRELNEDAVLTAEYRRDSQIEPATSLLYVIADGMGGAEAGEIASAIAVGTVREFVEARLGSFGVTELGSLIEQALEEANRKILEYQRVHVEARGMGSTGVGLVIVPPDAAMAWVGDSRAYLSEPSGLRQLSKDHSLVQRLIEIGQITAVEARTHEHKNVITRSLGARPNGPAGVETVAFRLKREDRLILCSDGLTVHVTDAQIQEIVRRHQEPAAAARELIAAALAGGGTDNISVIAIFAG
ncbi:MAG TPA: protein phosphatase 2C domain-containing protein [Candidatus Binataceae bacterium]|nr:protein phosphatase 2C domain-containing protein [Candidatus Binataceae bacterium]